MAAWPVGREIGWRKVIVFNPFPCVLSFFDRCKYAQFLRSYLIPIVRHDVLVLGAGILTVYRCLGIRMSLLMVVNSLYMCGCNWG